MWNEAVLALLKVLSWHLLGGTEEICENLIQDSWFPRFEPETSRLTPVFGSCPYCVHTYAITLALIKTRPDIFKLA
jgi:hypothetical protein